MDLPDYFCVEVNKGYLKHFCSLEPGLSYRVNHFSGQVIAGRHAIEKVLTSDDLVDCGVCKHRLECLTDHSVDIYYEPIEGAPETGGPTQLGHYLPPGYGIPKDSFTYEEGRRELVAALNTMDVPVSRLDVDNDANLRWLLRNLTIRNCYHDQHDKAMALSEFLLKERAKKQQ